MFLVLQSTILQVLPIPRSDLQQSSSLLAGKGKKIFLVIFKIALKPSTFVATIERVDPVYLFVALFLVCSPTAMLIRAVTPLPQAPTPPSYTQTKESHQQRCPADHRASVFSSRMINAVENGG